MIRWRTFAEALQVPCFRGDLQDVLSRYYHAARAYSADHIVRLTGDCPMADPVVIDRVIEFYLAGDYDYVSNVIKPTFPDGLDVEVFRFRCLDEAFHEAKLPSQREHVTPFIHSQPDRYKLGNYQHDVDLSQLRWTVDEVADFELVQRIYEALYEKNPAFTTRDVLEFLDAHPELKTHNLKHRRDEGFANILAHLKDPVFCLLSLTQWQPNVKNSSTHSFRLLTYPQPYQRPILITDRELARGSCVASGLARLLRPDAATHPAASPRFYRAGSWGQSP